MMLPFGMNVFLLVCFILSTELVQTSATMKRFASSVCKAAVVCAVRQSHDRLACFSVPDEKVVRFGDTFKMPAAFFDEVADPKSIADAPKYINNIERYVGTVKIPVGLVGPVKVHAFNPVENVTIDFDCLVPMATTEGALCASYNRGSKAIHLSGGATAAVLGRQMVRAPYFTFENVMQAAQFMTWFQRPENLMQAKTAIEAMSKHCKVTDLHAVQTDYSVHIHVGIDSADAAGQNMVTYAGRRVIDFVTANYKGALVNAFIEGGLNSGKRGSNLHMRGKGLYTVVDCLLPQEIVRDVLHTEVRDLVRFQRTHLKTSTMLGTLSYTAHVANGLTAFYIANGQDPACAAESQAGITHFEVRHKDHKEFLYASMTLPSLILATVGGGTPLPSQNACLSVMPAKHPEELACILATLCLGGELSFYAAMAAGEFDGAHWNATHKAAV